MAADGRAARFGRWLASQWREVVLVVLLVLLFAALLGVTSLPRGCEGFHPQAALTGDSDAVNRFLSVECPAVDHADAIVALAVDAAFALAYGTVLFLALSRWWHRAWRPRTFTRLRLIVLAPLAAAALDLAENLTLALTLGDDDDLLHISHVGAPMASVLGWWKWAFAIVAVVATALALFGAFGYRHTPAAGRTPTPAPDPTEPEGLGICLSGGGIRSASHSLGALQGLDKAGLFRPARYLSAVSGGAYTAMAWFVARETAARAFTVEPQPTTLKDGLLTDGDGDRERDRSVAGHLRQHRRYLATGRGGVVLAVVTVLVYLAVHLSILGLAVYLVSWPFGKLAASPFVLDDLTHCTYERCLDAVDVAWRHAIPGLAPLALAVVAIAMSAFMTGRAHRTLLVAAAALAAAGVTMLVVLVGIPFAIANGPAAFARLPGWLPGGSDTAEGAGLLGVLSGLGLSGALLRLLWNPLSKSASRLGGVVLAIGAVLLGGFFATRAAYDLGRLAEPPTFALAALVFCLVYFVVDQSWFSLHRIYLVRLRSTFSTEQRVEDGRRRVVGRPRSREGTWSEYVGRRPAGFDLPELLVCCAAQRSDSAATGVPAVSFVFSPADVCLNAVRTDADGSLHVDRHVAPSATYERSTTGTNLATPSAAAAMSGAAFTSAMGRHSLGSTNALLAALNLRLGVWMPNPSYVCTDVTRRFKKPRLSYLVKEIIGVYDLDDPYVYVTDGGHWENLGLVELVRRRCETIVCIDASGDKPGHFGTLHEAITLARIEAGAVIEIDLDPLLPDPATGLSHDCVAVGVVRYHAGPGHTPTSDCAAAGCQQGLLYYGKSLVSPYAPDAVQAFALQDPLFPRYPTYDQFLSEDEFDRMVDLGRSVAERVVHLQSVLDRAVAGKDRELLGLEETTLAAAYGALAGRPA